MLRKLLTFVLILAVLGVNLSRVFIYAGFEVNKTYIASTLCENRDKPQLHCNGKCYLMKKVKLAEQKEKNQERQSQKNILKYVLNGNSFQIKVLSKPFTVNYSPEKNFKLPKGFNFIFQPPKA